MVKIRSDFDVVHYAVWSGTPWIVRVRVPVHVFVQVQYLYGIVRVVVQYLYYC